MEAQKGKERKVSRKGGAIGLPFIGSSSVPISRERSNKRGKRRGKRRVRITTSRSGVSSSSV